MRNGDGTSRRRWLAALGLSGSEALASGGEMRGATGKRAAVADVTDFGAAGDGKTDDTAAIAKAVAKVAENGGVVFFPPGHYISRTIRAKSHITFLSFSAWGYHRRDGSAVIGPADAAQPCLFDLNDCIGTRLTGLTLEGRSLGEAMHGVVSKHPGAEQNIVIDDCQIAGFSGSGVQLNNCWVWAVRHSIIRSNGLDGIESIHSYDAWIIDNQLTSNGRMGIRGDELSSTAITANRVEWNKQGGIWLGPSTCSNVQIANCYFDKNFGPAVAIMSQGTSNNLALTGNLMRSNGWSMTEKPAEQDCQLLFRNAAGLVVTGNSAVAVGTFGHAGQKKRPVLPPSRGMVLARLTDSVIGNNCLHSCCTGKPIADEGGHQNCVIANNPGSVIKT